MSQSIIAGGLTRQDPSDIRVYAIDWDQQNLPVGVFLVDKGAISIVPDDGLLTLDQHTILAGNRTVQVRIAGGRAGRRYRLAHKVETTEVPPQTKEQSFYLLIQDC